MALAPAGMATAGTAHAAPAAPSQTASQANTTTTSYPVTIRGRSRQTTTTMVLRVTPSGTPGIDNVEGELVLSPGATISGQRQGNDYTLTARGPNTRADLTGFVNDYGGTLRWSGRILGDQSKQFSSISVRGRLIPPVCVDYSCP
ncbi:hypothetical protein JQN72_04655 [Phycicoccus sp. CSK15P-2]|uniref:hypothetical protein n=1 Tax=Phycicoccus sp. CSK15P-2 TaxID=2807627 RepID=UPI00195203D7|nr:hypothetical protein [Phycicoccus sp. CSK15P-2]MBM6403533.1 hypothetical protein [Phycicoccus sp. CSK15P-2]